METPLRIEKRSKAPRSMDLGSSHPDLAATLRAPTVTSMCSAVRNVTYLYPSVEIRYLLTMTMDTEDATLRVSAPTVPSSIGLLDMLRVNCYRGRSLNWMNWMTCPR